MIANHLYSTSLRNIDRLSRLVGVAVVAAILFGGLSVNRLLADRTAEINGRRRAAEILAAGAGSVDREVDSLRSEQAEASRALKSLKKRLTSTPNESAFNAALAEVAIASGMKIESFRPGRRGAVDGLGELHIQISCHGSYEAHCDFLNGLRNLPCVCLIESMKITAVGGGSELHSAIQIQLLFGTVAVIAGDAASGAIQQ